MPWISFVQAYSFVGLGTHRSASFYVPCQALVRGCSGLEGVYWLAERHIRADVGHRGRRCQQAFERPVSGRCSAATPPATLAWCWFSGVMWVLAALPTALPCATSGCPWAWPSFWGSRWSSAPSRRRCFTALALLANTGSGWITFAGIALAMGGVIIVARAGRMKERDYRPRAALPPPRRPENPLQRLPSTIFPRRDLSRAIFRGHEQLLCLRSRCRHADSYPDPRRRHLAVGPRTARAVRGAGRRIHDQLRLVHVSDRHESNCPKFRQHARTLGRGRGRPRTAAAQLSAVCARRHGLVFPILLLHHGREPDGRLRFSSWTLHMASIIILAPCGDLRSRNGYNPDASQGSWCGRG